MENKIKLRKGGGTIWIIVSVAILVVALIVAYPYFHRFFNMLMFLYTTYTF